MKRFGLRTLTLAFMGVVMLYYASNTTWGGDKWRSIIESDGKGYYSYLPAVFIYSDLSFSFHDSIEHRYYEPNTYYDYRVRSDGFTLNKYFPGTAVLQLPFFALGHLAAWLFKLPMDGFSYPYQIAINVAAIFYTLLGLYLLILWLNACGIRNSYAVFVAGIMLFGTPLFYYAVCEPSMSHIYSFFCISAFCLSAHAFFKHGFTSRKMWLIHLLFALIVLIRPANAFIFLSLPLLAGNRHRLVDGFRFWSRHPIAAIVSILTIFFVLSPIALYHYFQTGHWFVYTYGSEILDLSSPHFSDFLISYKKGLVVYSPLLMLSFVGLFYLRGWPRYTMMFFLIVLVWLLSSWSVWWYGGSFGQRTIVDFLPYLAFPIAIFLEKTTSFARNLSVVFCVLCVFFCQFQIYQYRYYLIHWEKMDRVHYWRVFLRTDGIGKGENPNGDLLSD